MAAPADPQLEPPPAPKRRALKQDPRPAQLRNFFEAYGCPLRTFTDVFIQEADDNALDWRLLPSISFVESSGGKYALNNNVFGWDSCRTKFPSVRTGIHVVADALGKSTMYKDKRLDDVLKLYNPRPEYRVRVKQVMRSIGPAYRPFGASLN